MKFSAFLFSIAFILVGLMFPSCGPRGMKYRLDEGMAWNTAYHITYESEHDLSDSIIRIINEIDLSLSPFNASSVVSAVNANISDSVDAHFFRVYEMSRKINAVSGGFFDPTLAPLIRAWGFGQGHEVSADTLRLDSLLRLVGIGQTRLQGMRLVKDSPEIEFNFSAIAKGYGVDCVADMLERNGVSNYLVEIGGEIRASGVNPKGTDWKIGIDRPDSDSPSGESVLTLSLTDSGLATSGNYRNFHEAEGRRFGHTISPVTGRPVQTDVVSATVIAPTCMEADALATCCMVLGADKALALCDSLGVGVLLVSPDLTVITNDLFP